MIKLAKSEKEEIISLSKQFVQIHKEILQIEKSIEKMQTKAKILIDDLENCRDEEKIFLNKLKQKYGEGHLDPMNFEWKNQESEYERN